MCQILYILDIKDLKKENIFIIGFSIFTLVFAIIYECFSHGVVSYFMILAFLIPLLNLILNCIFIYSKFKVTRLSKNLISMSIYTFTFFSIMKGVLDIFGTTNNLIFIYLIVGLLLFIFGVVSLLKK